MTGLKCTHWGQPLSINKNKLEWLSTKLYFVFYFTEIMGKKSKLERVSEVSEMV
jgi:hypothetical protein